MKLIDAMGASSSPETLPWEIGYIVSLIRPVTCAHVYGEV